MATISDYEIERGKPAPDVFHAIVQGNLTFFLHLKYGERYSILPELDIKIQSKIKVPDIAIYPLLKFNPHENELFMAKPPLCSIEIYTKGQSLSDFVRNKTEYFTAGVKSYWLALPDLKTIYVFYSPEDYDIYSGKDILKDKKLGIELDLTEIFK